MRKLLLVFLASLVAIATFSQLNMSQIGFLPYSQSLSDVWGYVDEAGNEYALVGTFSGLSIVDISDPSNPQEIFFGEGDLSIWRDIKTWGDYAYVSNESGGGVYIVDLSPLPDGQITSTANFTGSDFPFQTIHNIYIDESGKLYIFGANNGNGGAIICDLTQDPMNPVELGRFNDFYLHDGMARGDTLWGAGIYVGVLAAIDVTDPSTPQVMGTVSTPSQFTHNAWVSDDGTHVYTTDEVTGGFIGAYNVTDLSNIFETDRIQSSPGSGVIPHNAHVYNDFIVTSYYADGIVIHDAKYPDKLFEVANFDTSPSYAGNGYNGSWGAYPYLPSGVVLASDIEEGLYILEVDYIRAAFLEGIVSDINTGNPLFNVQVDIPGAGLSTQTAFDGSYEFGTTVSGTYDVEFSLEGYETKTVADVEINNGNITELNVELDNVSVGLSEEDLDMVNIRLYPNPFNDQITLDYDLPEEGGPYNVSLYNATGREVMQQDLAGFSGKLILGSDLSKGIYIVRLTAGSTLVRSERIIRY